jgi:CYTH domain-containing protein
MTENERKFLIEEVPPKIRHFRETKIRQGYLAVTCDREVRLRERRHPDSGGVKHTLTTKIGQGQSREEYEAELTEGWFRTLWPGTKGQRIRKTRCEINWDPWTIELDIYVRPTGLVTAEVELEEDADQFEVPDWFGTEITSCEGYKNKWLAKNGLPDQKPE